MTAWNLIPEYGRWAGTARRGSGAFVAAVAVLVVTGEVLAVGHDTGAGTVAVLGLVFSGAAVVGVYVRYLRDKVDRPFRRESIRTVRGAGYRLDPDG